MRIRCRITILLNVNIFVLSILIDSTQFYKIVKCRLSQVHIESAIIAVIIFIDMI